jgi:CIC family chloride channel protein
MFQLVIACVEKFRDYLLAFGTQNEIWQWGLPIVFILTGLFLSLFLVKHFAPEASGSGVQEIEGTLSEKRVIRWQRILPVKFFGGVLSLSAGMVAGREGPTIQMGGAIGEMLNKRFGIDPKFGRTLIAAGAAAGLSAAFNAPLAGILFVIEEMRPYFKYSFMSMQCVILASLASAIVLRITMGQQPDIPMTTFITPPVASIWLFVIFGCIFGVIGVIFNKYLLKTLDYFTYKKPKIYWMNIVLVGVCVGIFTKVYPEVIGGGYLVISKTLKMQLPAMALILMGTSNN